MKKSISISIILFSLYFFNSAIGLSVNKTLYRFCKKKDFLQRIKELVEEKHANVNYQTTQGHTPLMRASERGDEKLVEYLLSKGADATMQDLNDQTALHKAAQKGYLAIVKLLVKYKADVNKQDKKGNTPLHKAAKENNSKVCRYLMRKGASVRIKNKNDRTPDKVRNYTKSATFLKKEAAKPKK